MKLVIIDYGIGNTQSLINAFRKIGLDNIILTDNEEIINESDLIILPGVGAYGNAMLELKKRGLVKIIINYSKLNKPIVGICLGMQLLFDTSQEFGIHKGLGLIEGAVIKFPANISDKTPHVAWNNLKFKIINSKLFDSINKEDSFYFVHSYICVPKNDLEILTTTNYGGIDFCSSVKKNNIYGYQFHPEKSSKKGLLLLKNLINLIEHEHSNNNI
ncbi:imidazole glycerol phosphate synthase subunit HisH [Flavobacteriaceae bacterium]|nr:imidazole glycerol phosphate synthase subunit HisH [Flavobacteriaceae bacterium]